jgi:hypothetical protein
LLELTVSFAVLTALIGCLSPAQTGSAGGGAAVLAVWGVLALSLMGAGFLMKYLTCIQKPCIVNNIA